jgi:ubiquinone/menaquinone biosynthesis C-methylase UbiE
MFPANPLEDTPSTVTADGTIDFLAAWRTAMLSHADARIDPAVDRAFWEDYARIYDERTAMPGSYDRTLDALTTLVRQTDTLLDVGAGTGRFALPLARHMRAVTALDYSPAMLAILERKARDAGITNIAIVEAALETMTVPPHDIVLAAWSLYRQVDIAAALTALIRATTRTLVIAASDTAQAPHHPFLLEIWGRHGEPEHPVYLYLLGALRQLGYRADLRVLWETRCIAAPTVAAVARSLIPQDASIRDTERFIALLQPLLEETDAGWQYRYTVPVNLLVWHRSSDST